MCVCACVYSLCFYHGWVNGETVDGACSREFSAPLVGRFAAFYVWWRFLFVSSDARRCVLRFGCIFLILPHTYARGAHAQTTVVVLCECSNFPRIFPLHAFSIAAAAAAMHRVRPADAHAIPPTHVHTNRVGGECWFLSVAILRPFFF